MIADYTRDMAAALGAVQHPWRLALQDCLSEVLLESPHGDLARWLAALDALPQGPALTDVSVDCVRAGEAAQITAAQHEHLVDGLRALMPWRKGPFRFFGHLIDSEWRSDWKWQRLAPHLAPLAGRHVLDVGCGSGYHCWRMAGEGARFVLGVDPTVLYFMQYLSFRRYAPELPVWFAPARLERLEQGSHWFDTVFSMGVLYHQRSPLDHLLDLRYALRPGGELVLETLVVEGTESTVLVPPGRYAAMRNVFFLPSVPLLIVWLERCGFRNIRVVDVSVTSADEQRRTDWMVSQSLSDFLDPSDNTRTREGHPAPRRAMVLAQSVA